MRAAHLGAGSCAKVSSAARAVNGYYAPITPAPDVMWAFTGTSLIAKQLIGLSILNFACDVSAICSVAAVAAAVVLTLATRYEPQCISLLETTESRFFFFRSY